ncbi:pyridoxamine 5'-phosphate oxidase family protein [Candidatus Bathyarchaeota archaeon]|nr:pyridoxamine 5'-phosphate oxidase family protein [Candidatus Bathyarchaeota archaeon]
MRRNDKEVTDPKELRRVILEAKHITVAMCMGGEPYLATLSHGYDEENNRLYFHCAREGKKIDFLRSNPVVWGQALIDGGYQQGSCDHLYRTTQFRGSVTFVEDYEEKTRALRLMAERLDEAPERIISEQVKPSSVGKVTIGRIDVDYMSSKKADEVIISL